MKKQISSERDFIPTQLVQSANPRVILDQPRYVNTEISSYNSHPVKGREGITKLNLKDIKKIYAVNDKIDLNLTSEQIYIQNEEESNTNPFEKWDREVDFFNNRKVCKSYTDRPLNTQSCWNSSKETLAIEKKQLLKKMTQEKTNKRRDIKRSGTFGKGIRKDIFCNEKGQVVYLNSTFGKKFSDVNDNNPSNSRNSNKGITEIMKGINKNKEVFKNTVERKFHLEKPFYVNNRKNSSEMNSPVLKEKQSNERNNSLRDDAGWAKKNNKVENQRFVLRKAAIMREHGIANKTNNVFNKNMLVDKKKDHIKLINYNASAYGKKSHRAMSKTSYQNDNNKNGMSNNGKTIDIREILEECDDEIMAKEKKNNAYTISTLKKEFRR